MELISLKDVISALTSGNFLHICIHDVSGILKIPRLSVDYVNEIHSSALCNTVKMTDPGYDTCIRCKNVCNHRAIIKKRGFSGVCSFGLFEAAEPCVIDGRVVCIVYVGNILSDEQKLRKTASLCHVPNEALEKMLSEKKFETVFSARNAENIAKLTAYFIAELYEKYKDTSLADADETYHRAVLSIKKYVDNNYSRSLLLSDICKLYFINEKYAGRLFKKQVGMSFHEYLSEVRLKHAARLLRHGGEKRIIDCALECGFSSVTYFNRLFFKRYGTTPGNYRKG